MQYINVQTLFNNYQKYLNDYVFLGGYYNDNYIYNDNKCDPQEKIFCPSGHHLDLDYYLLKAKRKNYSGPIRIVGKIGNKMHRIKSIDRIVKVDFVDLEGRIVDSLVNRKVPLPKVFDNGV